MDIKASLIISVYHNVAALKTILDSLKSQTCQDFEIIISEDSCCKEMAEFVGSYDFSNPHRHLTQEDIGWRKNLALNRAILAAKSEWIILIDGDCVLHPRFVEHHIKESAPDRILAGKRVKLSDYYSQKLMGDITYIKELNRILLKQTFFLAGKNGNQYCEEGVFVNPRGIFGFVPRLRRMKTIKGCNLSFSKSAIMKINGFDMDYTRPAIGEDIDLAWRFKAAGFKIKSVRNLAVQYHLNHRENWHDQSENEAMMREKQSRNQYICINGISKLENS